MDNLYSSARLLAILTVKLILLGFSDAITQGELPEKRAVAVFTETAPEIDGRVDESWLNAPVQNHFLQREPDEGSEALHDTRFYVMYDHRNVYFLFIMQDDDPASIPVRLLERDQEFSPDDHISFYLDTYNDQRKAFFFSTNPAGVEQDGLVSENGSNVDMSWDAIFKVAARVNKFGWVAEFAIPYTSLRFTDELNYQIWGFNVWRIRKKNREISYWSLVNQDFESIRLDKGGILVGMQDVKSGLNLKILPYFTGRHIRDVHSSETDPNTGVDIKYGITSNLTLDATVNPDFGQVEIDEEQINLDKRYEIQLEEKRPFFLENANLFHSPYYHLFYSRRIGALSDIKAGAKLTGKIDNFSIGILEAYTGGWENFGLGEPDSLPTDELFSVIRAQADILASSNIGLMYVDRAADLGGRNPVYNRAGGMDLTLHMNQFYLVGQGVYSYNANQGEILRGGAGYGQAGYYGHLFRADAYMSAYSPDFNLDNVGFFQKNPGKGRTYGGLYADVHPFFSTGIFRSWGFGLNPEFVQDSDESEPGLAVSSLAWLEFRDQSRIEAGITRYRDTETDLYYFLFRQYPGRELTYVGTDAYVKVTSDVGKPVSVIIQLSRNRQYYFQLHSTGYNRGLEGYLRMKPLSNAYLEAGFQNKIFLDEDKNLMPIQRFGQPDVKIWSLRARYLVTKDIFTRLFYQITNNAENLYRPDPLTPFYEYQVRDRMSANFLIGWRFRPGSTLYLAYTEEWNEQNSKKFISTNRILYIKLSYLWSF